MSDEKPHNPPAFPSHIPHQWAFSGMTMRDAFALAALPHYLKICAGYNADTIACDCYKMADAMLAERLKE